MNCKQAEQLLALYAGRDLDEKRAALGAEHLQACAPCAEIANEYREISQIAQQFAAPVFSDDGYARVRRNVLSEIETQASAASLSDLFFGWLRPRTTWAIASALVLVFAAAVLYFIANGRGSNEVITSGRNAVTQATPEQTHDQVTAGPGTPSTESIETPRAPKQRFVRPRRTAVLTANVQPPPSGNVPPSVPESTEPGPASATDASQEGSLRVEMQTRDPNIRIIWFTQPVAKPVPLNSKGI